MDTNMLQGLETLIKNKHFKLIFFQKIFTFDLYD